MRWRHVKTGGTYVELFRGKMQAKGAFDMQPVVVYRSEADGSVWTRLESEFEDGRFEKIEPTGGTCFVLHDGEDDEKTQELHKFMDTARKLQEEGVHGGYCFDWEGDESGVYVTQAVHARTGDVFVMDPKTGHITVERNHGGS